MRDPDLSISRYPVLSERLVVERLVNVYCQDVVSVAMAAASVRLIIQFFRMIVSYVTKIDSILSFVL